MNKHQLAVKAILKDLMDRKGIRNVLESIEPEIMEEIKAALEVILKDAFPLEGSSAKPPMKVVFHGNGGYEGDRERARKALEVGKEYLVIGGTMGQSITYYELEGIKGRFNSVLFTGNPHEAPVGCPYFLGGKL